MSHKQCDKTLVEMIHDEIYADMRRERIKDAAAVVVIYLPAAPGPSGSISRRVSNRINAEVDEQVRIAHRWCIGDPKYPLESDAAAKPNVRIGGTHLTRAELHSLDDSLWISIGYHENLGHNTFEFGMQDKRCWISTYYYADR